MSLSYTESSVKKHYFVFNFFELKNNNMKQLKYCIRKKKLVVVENTENGQKENLYSFCLSSSFYTYLFNVPCKLWRAVARCYVQEGISVRSRRL